jgi:hypothetical protein
MLHRTKDELLPALDEAGPAGRSALGCPKRSPSALLEKPHGRPGDDDPLDPFARHAAHLAPPLALSHAAPPAGMPAAPITSASPSARTLADGAARTSLEDLLPQLVRRVAWSGDGRRGAVRLELGVGALAGATLLVQSDGGQVRVQLSAPPGLDVDAWRIRIAERLASRELSVDAVDVG